MTDELLTHTGGCHCGRVTFELSAPARLTAFACNCSMCRMQGFVHVIVPRSRFRLLSGDEDLIEYRFNSRIARHLFCRHCGVESFYVPRSNPDGYSINLNCLDPSRLEQVDVREFDGDNWEANAEMLADLSRE